MCRALPEAARGASALRAVLQQTTWSHIVADGALFYSKKAVQ